LFLLKKLKQIGFRGEWLLHVLDMFRAGAHFWLCCNDVLYVLRKYGSHQALSIRKSIVFHRIFGAEKYDTYDYRIEIGTIAGSFVWFIEKIGRRKL
jgi:hypothetical protein